MFRPLRQYARSTPLVSLWVTLALLVVTASAAAAPPVLTVPGAQSVSEQQNLNFNVSATDPDGQTCQLRAFFIPTNATFADHHNNTGTFDWTPASDQSGSYTVQFRADDTFGGIVNRNVAITVLNANAAPNLGFIADRTVDPGTMAILSLWAQDDDGDALSFSQTGLPAWGEFTDYGDNTASIVLSPPLNTPGGSMTVTVTVTDGMDPISQSFVVTVTGSTVQHAPTLDDFTEPTLAEGTTATLTLAGNDQDGDVLTWTSGLPSFASLTTLTSEAGHTTARLSLAPGYCAAGNYSATVGVSDGALQASRTFTIHVTDTPRSPAWSAPTEGTTVTLDVGASQSVALAASDPDQDCGSGAPVLSVASSDAGGALTTSVAATGPGAGNLNVHANGPAGTYHVTVSATDATDPTRKTDRTLTVVVNAVEEPPVPLAAAAWIQPKQIRSETGADWQRVYVEPANGSFDLNGLVPSSFKVKAWDGAGSGEWLCPMFDGVLKGTDANSNGTLEYRLTFDKVALVALFSNVHETTDGMMTVTGRLEDGRTVSATFAATFVPEKPRAIKRAGPNPLNPEATVSIRVDAPGRLRVMVFDVHGRMVRLLLNDANAPAGTRDVTFNGKDDRGRSLRAGRYYIRVETPVGRDATSLTILP